MNGSLVLGPWSLGLLCLGLCGVAMVVFEWRSVRAELALWQRRARELMSVCRHQDARIQALERHNVELQQRLRLDIHVHQDEDEDDADWWKHGRKPGEES